ncbi:hypothetical protein CAP36_12450 [Chitinophagaceae bacterium IBVUCB2]|nr:hypothetical protein CAP36_12450 [Chitinophagaceae bacterium IBVUCB2]
MELRKCWKRRIFRQTEIGIQEKEFNENAMFRLKLIQISENPLIVRREFVGNPIAEFSETFDKFMGYYRLKDLVSCDELHKRPLAPKKERICRFCKATYSKDEKFKSKAHLVPDLLGNDHLLSDFECDKCNNLFGKIYENDLANFLGVSRAMFIGNAWKGSLKFKSPDKTFIVMKDKETPADIPKLRLESHEEENDHFTLDAENKKITFHTIRHSYNPHHVYKAFLKIGLSILPQTDVKEYSIALAMLLSEKKNEEPDNPMYKMNMYVHPGPAFPCPLVLFFEKKNKMQPVPMHIVCIMFHNHTYQLVLPLNKQDKWMYDGKTTITVPNMPPFIDKHFAKKFGNPKEHRLNFNLDELKKGEKHDITYTFEDHLDTRYPTTAPLKKE